MFRAVDQPVFCGQPGPELALSRRIRRVRESSELVAGILARQDGVIARRQALSSGMTTGQIRHQLQAGSWVLVHPAVYRSSAHPLSTAARIRAVGLWGGPNAVLSGIAAAWWWGLETKPPATVEIVIPRAENRRSKPGAKVVRRDLAARDRDWFRAAPITALPLTVMIASVQLGPDGPALLDRALQTKVTMSSLRSTYYSNLGIQGSATAAASDPGGGRSDRSGQRTPVHPAAEVGRRPRVAGQPPLEPGRPVLHHRCGLRPGATGHRDRRLGLAPLAGPVPTRPHQTNERSTLAGWTVLRFTWFDLTERPGQVVSDVRRALLQHG